MPRPGVVLSKETFVSYVKHNDSYIRAPICEGIPDYVDLDLTGERTSESDRQYLC